MTNNELLLAVQTWLGTLTDGYTVRRGTYSLKDVQENLPIMLLRKSGNGVINSNIIEKMVRVGIVVNQAGWPTASDDIDAIAAKARDKSVAAPVGAIKIRLMGGTVGPLTMEDENQMLYLDLMVTL